GRRPLHLADGNMHPHERDGDDEKEQPEAALPYARQVVERAESDRQHEAAEAADQSDNATNRADAIGVVDRDVFVDRSLTEAHEEAQYEGGDDEADEAHAGRKSDGAADTFDDVLSRRIGQDER